MFKCEKCQKNSKPYEKLHKYPVEVRNKIYQNELKEGRKIKIITSCGYEIVKELNVCESCYCELKQK